MPLTVDQLTQWRASLIEARLTGLRELEDQNGERVVYKSDRGMQRAIEAVDREIARLGGHSHPSTIHFRTSKGVC